jgi:hypothetical protein
VASNETLCIWNALGNEPPATGYATLDQRNAHAILDFDAAATEGAMFSAVLPRNYAGGGITVTLTWMASTATSGAVFWGTAFERMNTDLDADSFATQVTGASTANGTSGIITTVALAHTNGASIDSIAVGDAFRLQVQRIGGNGGDTMTGDAELLTVELRET